MVGHVCRLYLHQGFVVANVEYRKGAIAPAVEDAIRALGWFCRNAPNYGVDPHRIVVTGESSGAHLALMAAFQSGVEVAAVVNFYGITDLTAMADRPAIQAVLPPGDWKTSARRLSPLTYVRQGLPPVLSIHGTADAVVPPDQTARLAEALRSTGGEAAEFYMPGAGHGFSSMQQVAAAYRVVFQFLAQRGIILN
jgi:dipeptidyl aminopeptidase/acylaminoacyl peptidase